ncbi:hypothetical protein [Miltoncostaea marina]|uniref:hypothetical protein n=1 Tax=Miltoncostaea marina TaxID=2843215 RepID=UPI001C3DBE80|nr:hypothetical protein [Miltoncostaea marina]
MAPLAPHPTSPAARIEPIAVAWGGLVASIGLMAGAGRDWPLRLAAAALAFGLGGFLAGMRAPGRRAAHAAGAWAAAYLLDAVFVALARVIDALGGPDAPALVPGSAGDWAVAALWALALALAGGLAARSLLRPPGQPGSPPRPKLR